MRRALETVIVWKWTPTHGYKSTFGPQAVNTLRRLVARYYPKPHRFVCVTDDPSGLDPRVEVVPLWREWGDVPSPHGPAFPSCYRRLRVFAPDAADLFGARFVSLDLDVVITGDLRPVWDRDEDFVIWQDTNPKNLYNGSMFLLTSGARVPVWERFDPLTSPQDAYRAGCNGSDQGWISYVLGPGEATWTRAHGVYSFKNELLRRSVLPSDARVVLFHGDFDPWMPRVRQRWPWVREHYPMEAA